MKTYGVRKKDNNCCIGHAKYGVKQLTSSGNRKKRSSTTAKNQDKARKAKERQKKINTDE